MPQEAYHAEAMGRPYCAFVSATPSGQLPERKVFE
jgi:hypothetical protein